MAFLLNSINIFLEPLPELTNKLADSYNVIMISFVHNHLPFIHIVDSDQYINVILPRNIQFFAHQ